MDKAKIFLIWGLCFTGSHLAAGEESGFLPPAVETATHICGQDCLPPDQVKKIVLDSYIRYNELMCPTSASENSIYYSVYIEAEKIAAVFSGEDLCFHINELAEEALKETPEVLGSRSSLFRDYIEANKDMCPHYRFPGPVYSIDNGIVGFTSMEDLCFTIKDLLKAAVARE